MVKRLNLIRFIHIILPLISSYNVFSQNIIGTYTGIDSSIKVILNNDSTFLFTSRINPSFYRVEGFSEKGRWTFRSDTIVFNPQFSPKINIESEIIEKEYPNNKDVLLTFNHIKRYFDAEGNLLQTDTLKIEQLDYTFNKLVRKNLRRVTSRNTTRCSFAGYIPSEIITKENSIIISKPSDEPNSIFIGCYELQETKEFILKNKKANHLTFNVFSNYYKDSQLRQMKYLLKNSKIIYTVRKRNGKFKKTFWLLDSGILKKTKI